MPDKIAFMRSLEICIKCRHGKTFLNAMALPNREIDAIPFSWDARVGFRHHNYQNPAKRGRQTKECKACNLSQEQFLKTDNTKSRYDDLVKTGRMKPGVDVLDLGLSNVTFSLQTFSTPFCMSGPDIAGKMVTCAVKQLIIKKEEGVDMILKNNGGGVAGVSSKHGWRPILRELGEGVLLVSWQRSAIPGT